MKLVFGREIFSEELMGGDELREEFGMDLIYSGNLNIEDVEKDVWYFEEVIGGDYISFKFVD